ncbi:MAG: thiamine phosphate synthase [Proteobacteria bacterium]|nr:thiamine phosphate synthase [Pseudomonadota bacterium]
MRPALPAPPFLVITDRLSATKNLSYVIPDVLKAGCRWLMVREKDLGTAALGELVKEVVDQARPFGGCVMVNGDIDAAESSGAAGVHLQLAAQVASARERLGDNALIGVSTHSPKEAHEAAGAGADYITISPVFLTHSKPGYGPALGIGGLATLCQHISLPVVALAGITPASAASCLGAGAAAVAVMGTIMRSATPGAMVREYLRCIGH